MISACTIIARNYLVHARVLARSFFAQHPDGSFTVLLIDDEQRAIDDSQESFQCCRLIDIGLDRAEIGRLAASYDVTELATAVKPPFLRHLLSRGATDVIYLDPDIKLYGSLDEVSRLARQHGIVLTPHMTSSMPPDGRRIDDFHILAAGVYNLGFIAVNAGADRLITWWWEKTRRQARIDPTRMMFTDQRWMDFAPSFFDHYILRDPGYNVAYWNLHERDVAWTGEKYLVNGRPLTFFHFSGFDWRQPHLLSKHQGERPRILLSERPGVARICREYVASLEECGLLAAPDVSYGWLTLPSGLPFDRHMRRLYGDGLVASETRESESSPEPPNPFDPVTEAEFIRWLNVPVAGGLWPTISRYLLSIYESRPDVQRALPDLATHENAYLEWVRRDGQVQEHIPAALLPTAAVPASDPLAAPSAENLSDGVNIVGYFRAELGVGEAARLLTTAIEAAEIPHSTVVYKTTPSRQAHEFVEHGDPRAPHDITILCINADQTAAFAKQAGSGFFAGRHTVGYWFWELDRFPVTMHQAFDYVDEVWTATRFVASGIRAIGRRPVYTVPLPVPIPRCSPDVSRASLGLPEGFLFLFVFDFFSVLERKNPLGLIDAFGRAFRPGEGPTLLIKTINGAFKLTDLERVRAASQGREDILVVDEYYTSEQKNALLGLCDSYVSLHRSEGLGLTMAEAMGLAKPVIATGYSGNVDFMTPENSYLVDYTTGAVPKGSDPYPPGSPWAEPNLDQAAELMRRVYEAPTEAARIAARARQDIVTKHDAKASAVAVAQRLAEIRRTRSRSVAIAGHSPGRTAVDTMPESSHADNPVAAVLDHASSLLTPTAQVSRGRQFRGPLLFLQNLLFRVLRPYWWQQRQLQSVLIDSLRLVSQQASRAAQSEPHQRAALEAVWKQIHTMDEEHLGGAARFQSAAAAHLKALTDQLGATTAKTTELSHRLYAAPYMQDPGVFRYSDGDKRVLGFRARRPGEGQGYAGFEDIFRGSESFIQGRQRVYLPLLARHQRVIDIGCGRGEMLDLLREAGVAATGVDVDDVMVERCRAKGHAVEHTDGITYLRNQRDGSIPAIFAAQVVEHLPYDDLLSFLQLSRTRLAPGGRLIFETPNPHALEAFKTFWTDLTHQRPIFPEVALAWCWLLGFEDAYVLFPNGVGDFDTDRTNQGEYAVVATTPSAQPPA